MILIAQKGHKDDWVKLNQAFYYEEQTGQDDPRLQSDNISELFNHSFDFMLDKSMCRMLLCYEDNQAVGFLTEITYPSAWSGGWTVYVDDLYVLPEYRRQGVATQLMDEVERYAKEIGAKRLQLLVEPHNPAKLFYAQQGYSGISLEFHLKHLKEQA